ncbi:hypothetical protein KI387_009361, partial [Taxus chinensis]
QSATLKDHIQEPIPAFHKLIVMMNMESGLANLNRIQFSVTRLPLILSSVKNESKSKRVYSHDIHK